MTFSTILYTILIGPLKLLFEVIYMIAYQIIGNAGLAIIALSLAMNFLVLPLYRRIINQQMFSKDLFRLWKKLSNKEHVIMNYKIYI